MMVVVNLFWDYCCEDHAIDVDEDDDDADVDDHNNGGVWRQQKWQLSKFVDDAFPNFDYGIKAPHRLDCHNWLQ